MVSWFVGPVVCDTADCEVEEEMKVERMGEKAKAEIKVCGITYLVIVQEHFKAYDDERNLWGYCDYERQIIYVRESLSEEKEKGKC